MLRTDLKRSVRFHDAINPSTWRYTRRQVPARVTGFLAGILESKNHFGADPALPIGGGVRAVATDDPTTFPSHVASGERLFLVPNWRVTFPIPYGMWPRTVGAAEIFVAVSIWPERLERWGVWEAEKYFRERIEPLMEGRENRPVDWWQRPDEWRVR